MKTKKLISLFLAVLMLMSLLTPVAVSASTEYTGLREELYNLVSTNMIPPGSNFTASSVAVYMDAVDRGKAVLEDENATDEELQNAIDDITNALDSLQYVNLDTQAIGELMRKGEEIFSSGVYTEESSERYRAAYTEAISAALYGQSQSEVNNACEKLSAAIESLEAVAIRLILGDADNSGGVNVKDATVIQKYIADLVDLSHRYQVIADVNGDSVFGVLPNVTIKDATAIQKFSASIDPDCYAQGVKIGEYFMYDLSQEKPDVPLTTTTEATDSTEPVVYHPIPYEFVSSDMVYYDWDYVWDYVWDLADPVFAVAESSDKFYEEWYRIFKDSGKAYRLPEDIDDEYFETHNLIIYLSMIGSSSSSVNFNGINVGGDQLIADLSIFVPETHTDDIQYLLTVIGVNKEDVEGVTRFDESKTYEYEDRELTDPTDENMTDPTEPVVCEDIPYAYVMSDRLFNYSYGEEPVFRIADYETQFRTAWEEIYRDEYGSNNVPEQFDEEYFETHSLIILTCFVGAGTDSHTINRVSVAGNKLYVDRTRYTSINPTPDMNYEVVILEVRKRDVHGVDEFELRTRIDDAYDHITTVPDYDTIDIYFKDTENWQGINVFFYSETDYDKYPQWPGVSMECIYEESGGDIYKAAVPADADLIMFNSVVANIQTNEIWKGGFKHQDLFVPVKEYDGYWEVECALYYLPEPTATSEPVTEVVTEPETEPETEPATNGESEIDFTVSLECRVQGWEDPSGVEETELFLVKSPVEADNVLNLIKGTVDSVWEPKPVRDPKYNDEFFENNSLIIAFVPLSSGSYTQKFEKLVVENGILTIYRLVEMPSISTCDMNYRVAVIEVANKDIEAVAALTDIESYYWYDVE